MFFKKKRPYAVCKDCTQLVPGEEKTQPPNLWRCYGEDKPSYVHPQTGATVRGTSWCDILNPDGKCKHFTFGGKQNRETQFGFDAEEAV